jgi:3-polyprenyl-4-hydroxybenzoate decarboxylase
MQPDRDIILTGIMHGASLDPSSPLFRSTSKLGMDCTIPVGNTPEDTKYNRERHERAIVTVTKDIEW